MLPRRQEDVGLIKEAVAQTGARQDAYEAVDEQGVEQFVFYFLLFIEASHQEVGQQ